MEKPEKDRMMIRLTAPTAAPVSPEATAPPSMSTIRARLRPILSMIVPTARAMRKTPIVA
jgi:hypothetical protein